MAVTGYTTVIGAGAGQIGEVLQSEWLNRQMLDELVPGVVLYRYGTHPDMPLSTAKKARWLIFSRITPDASPTATTEGTEPTTARNTDVTAYDATIAEYADYITVSSLLDLTSISGTSQKFARLMGQLGAEQIENVISDTLDAHALAADVDISETDLAVDGIFNVTELFKAESLRRIALKLVKGFGRPHPAAMTGRKFCLVCSPRIFYEFAGDTQAASFGGVTTGVTLAIAQAARRMAAGNPVDTAALEKGYFDSGDVLPGMFGVELIMDLGDRTVTRSSLTTQNNFAMADQAFGLVDLNSNLAQPAVIKKVPGPTTVSVPTNSYQTVGYRIYFACVLFNAATMVFFASV